MKRTLLLIFCLAAVGLTVAKVKMKAQAAPLRGYSAVIPYRGNPQDALNASLTGATIPLSSYTFTASKDGKSYTDVIVGQSPFQHGHSPTTVKVLLVPMIINIGTSVFDSTVANSCAGSNGHTDLANFQNSPIMTSLLFDGGSGAGHASTVNGVNMTPSATSASTYNDTHRRAEFLGAIGGASSNYHTRYAVTVTPVQTITAATSAGHSAIIAGTKGNCNYLGGLDIEFFDGYFSTTVLNAVGGDPSYFVVFLMRDVVFYDTTVNNCCILGYHGTLNNFQTYSPTDYDTTLEFGGGIVDVSVAAHEVGEWLDDPLGNNPTPLWGGIGQVGGCQNNWEVGDPLTGTDFPSILMPNGVTYHPQETVFWSWYYSADHDAFFQNIEAGGKYSMNGTFGGPSKVCPPGGTFPN